MNKKQKQEWITPKLVEYGDVAKLTEDDAKFFGGGDQICKNLTVWISGVERPG
jgi:hypothetical protein